MAKKNIEKTQQQHRKLVLYLIAVMIFAMVIEILILNSFNKKNSNRTSLVLLNQVAGIIRDNEKSENELIETLKEDYIIRAQTVSYILDSKPEAEYDIQELQKIAGMMQIDEIHLFDETGEIYSGTEPKYYGYSFYSGEQMAYFKPMLDDKSLTMCQDVTPNTAEGKSMMYAITWNDAGDKMIQVGIEPVRLIEELRRNEIPEVVANMPAYEGIDILVADAASGVIYGATDDALVDRTLDEIGITGTDMESGATSSATLEIEGDRNYCNIENVGEYTVVVAYSVKASIKKFNVAMVIEFLYLLLAGLVIIYMFKQVLRADREKNTQMALLVSMSDIYNSMHLIDLDKDTVVEYNARAELSEVVNNTCGANETLKQMITLTTEDEYREAALAFTDMYTIADRMKNRKIISGEFMSKVIGWYRASLITIETDYAGHPVKLIYVTQNIDKEKKEVEELIQKSNADELTGLYNRRAYEEDIAEYDHKGIVDSFVFVSLDVNGLKTVNDNLGHVAGDELLIGAANCIEECFGQYGKIYRIGGDEFVAMISVNEIQLQVIKRNFEDTTAKWSGNLVDSLSVSCGYVTKMEAGNISMHEMANIADKRMYEAKNRFYENNTRRRRRIR